MQDGLYTLEVVAVDAAQNTSFPAWSLLRARAERAAGAGADDSQTRTRSGPIDGNPNDTYVCTLSHDNRVVSGPQTVRSHPVYDMTSLAPGTYTLSVVQIGAEGVRSAPGSATWLWNGVAPPPHRRPATRRPPHHHSRRAPTKPPAQPGPAVLASRR